MDQLVPHKRPRARISLRRVACRTQRDVRCWAPRRTGHRWIIPAAGRRADGEATSTCGARGGVHMGAFNSPAWAPVARQRGGAAAAAAAAAHALIAGGRGRTADALTRRARASQPATYGQFRMDLNAQPPIFIAATEAALIEGEAYFRCRRSVCESSLSARRTGVGNTFGGQA